jgi:hypothetical protein
MPQTQLTTPKLDGKDVMTRKILSDIKSRHRRSYLPLGISCDLDGRDSDAVNCWDAVIAAASGGRVHDGAGETHRGVGVIEACHHFATTARRWLKGCVCGANWQKTHLGIEAESLKYERLESIWNAK